MISLFNFVKEFRDRLTTRSKSSGLIVKIETSTREIFICPIIVKFPYLGSLIRAGVICRTFPEVTSTFISIAQKRCRHSNVSLEGRKKSKFVKVELYLSHWKIMSLLKVKLEATEAAEVEQTGVTEVNSLFNFVSTSRKLVWIKHYFTDQP